MTIRRSQLSVFAVIVLMVPAIGSSCELAEREQVNLISFAGTMPSTEKGIPISLAGNSVLCWDEQSLVIVRLSQSSRSFYILDRKRAFHRWEETGNLISGDPLAELRRALENYQRAAGWKLWEYYGRALFETSDIQTLKSMIAGSPRWIPITLMTPSRYQQKMAEKLDTAEEAFMKSRIRDEIRLFLAYNSLGNAEITDERYGQLARYLQQITARIVLVQQGRKEALELVIPLNSQMAPFAGRPIRWSRD